MVEPRGRNRKEAPRSCTFFVLVKMNQTMKPLMYENKVEDEIFIAEPQPLPQSGGFNQPLPDCCESTNESPNAANIDENPDSANHTSWINSAYNFSAA